MVDILLDGPQFRLSERGSSPRFADTGISAGTAMFRQSELPSMVYRYAGNAKKFFTLWYHGVNGRHGGGSSRSERWPKCGRDD